VNAARLEANARTLADVVHNESKRVHAVCYRITNNTDWAAEAFQDAFLRLAKWMKALDETKPVPDAQSLGGLMQVLAERAATDVLRRNLRVLAHEEARGSPLPGETGIPDRGIDFERLLQRLSLRERQVLTLAFEEGYSSEEIANRMNLSAVAVRVMKSRSIRKLREELKKTGRL
jgi:RNA polymerase sigma-70 factor (ECF subfamily)